MRTLHVAATFGRGGIATSLWHLLPALNKLPGNQVEGAAFYEVGWFGALLRTEGVPIHHLQMAAKYDPRVLWKLFRLCQSFDVVHAHGWPVILFVALVSFLSGKTKYVLTEHSVTNGRRRPYLRWLDRFIYSRFNQIVAVSRAVADSLQEWQPHLKDKISVVYNGINVDYLQTAEPQSEIRRQLKLSLQTPLIFASGNFRFAKGFDLLLQSIALLMDRYQQADQHSDNLPVLVITGDGTMQTSMKALAGQLGIGDRVFFLGFRRDMPDILRAADLFVLSSRWEGCPMVILESMALGVPILATRVGGVPELVKHDQTGKLIPAGSPAELAGGLYQLLMNKEKAACLAEHGQKWLFDHFTVGKSAEALAVLYRQSMGFII